MRVATEVVSKQSRIEHELGKAALWAASTPAPRNSRQPRQSARPPQSLSVSNLEFLERPQNTVRSADNVLSEKRRQLQHCHSQGPTSTVILQHVAMCCDMLQWHCSFPGHDDAVRYPRALRVVGAQSAAAAPTSQSSSSSQSPWHSCRGYAARGTPSSATSVR